MSDLHSKTPRKITSIEAAALSVGFMGPVMAMALNGIGVAGLVGTSVPFTFALAFLGVLVVAYAFFRLSRKYTHSGSVYALAGRTIGPRAGFFAGFALLGTYLFFAACILGACGVFFGSLTAALGWDASVPWPLLLIVVAALVLWVNLHETRFITTVLLVIGGLGIGMMLVLSVIILGTVASGAGPADTSVDITPLLPGNAPASAVMSASVFAFLSWAGFESCTSLAEETRNPKRAIPFALIGSVVICGLIYVFVMYAQTIGFGTTEAGVTAFASSESSLIELALMYTNPLFAQLLALSAFAVAFASALSSTAAAARLLFALSRDGFGPSFLAKTSPSNSAPRNSAVSVVVLTVVLALGLAVFGVGAFDTYYWYATIAVLCLIVAYAMTSVGAIFATVRRTIRIPKWELVIPALALIYLAYVYIVQVWGQPAPYSYFPWIAGAWCGIGLVVTIVKPSLTKNIGDELVKEAG